MSETEKKTHQEAEIASSGCDKAVKIVASGLGAGYSPLIEGTVGAVWGVGIYLLLMWLQVSVPVYAVVTVALVAIAVPICTRAEKLFGGKDPGRIVLDEIVSMPITLFFVPFELKFVIIGFVLNRVFDIVKIPPARQSQKLSGGWGVVIDDVIAGIQSNLMMHLIIFLWGT